MMSPCYVCEINILASNLFGQIAVSKIIIEIMVFVLAKGRNVGYSYLHNDYRDKQFAAADHLTDLTITGGIK